MITIQQHIVPDEIPGIRLLDYALKVFTTIPSRSSMKKLIKRGELLVDGQPGKQGSWVTKGQKICLVDLEINSPKPLDIEIDIVFEDEHLAIINKPAGIEVSGNKYYTIQNALIGNISISNENDALKWPRPVHRLDRPTSGLLMVAKTKSALTKLGQQLENREVQKIYHAIVSGSIPDEGTINIDVDELEAKTSFRCIDRYPSLKINWISLVELMPHTGRTHQLRKHLLEIGHPIAGDKQYTSGPILKGKGLFLSAVELRFIHPYNSTPMIIKVEHPKKFDSFIDSEKCRWQKYHQPKKSNL